jgi:DNA polymerase elongation subunit (family B)
MANASRVKEFGGEFVSNKPKVLIFDIETAPILGHVWGLWENNVGLNQIQSDWHVLAWAAKWLGDPASKTMYMDQRRAKNVEDDRKILKGIWKLLDEADIVITQNGKAFDVKKLNARFILQGFKPPSSFKHIDTKQIASRKFAFTSNKLEYMTDKLCTKYRKLKHTKFPGHQLWNECLKGNLKAWKEMERYNKYDVLSLEELYHKLQPWDSSINFHAYTDELQFRCNCGSTKMIKNGSTYRSVGKYQRYSCSGCGAEHVGRVNLLTAEKRESLRVGH